MRIRQPRQLIPVENNRVVCAQLLLCDLETIKIQHMGMANRSMANRSMAEQG